MKLYIVSLSRIDITNFRMNESTQVHVKCQHVNPNPITYTCHKIMTIMIYMKVDL